MNASIASSPASNRVAGGPKMTRVTHAILVATLLTAPVLVERAYAHHGAGLYEMRKKVELEGKLTRVDFVNPHTYVYFDVVGADGKVIAMKCETRGATVLRRSGWSPEMFVRGASIKVTGSPHRDDPTACTVDTMTLGNKPTLERYQQLSDAKSVNRTKRPFRLSNGKPNLAGDWAQEQQVLATAARRARRARADQPGRRDQRRQTADAGRTRRLVRAASEVDRSGTGGSRRAAQAADVGEPAALLPGHEHPVRLGVRRRDRPHHAERELPSRWSTASA